MKAGLFLVKNNITEKTFIVSVNGTEPFLRISNIINTTDFVNGKLNVDEEEKKSILEVPNNYSFNELSKEIEQVKEIPIEERLPKITENAYNKLKTGEGSMLGIKYDKYTHNWNDTSGLALTNLNVNLLNSFCTYG